MLRQGGKKLGIVLEDTWNMILVHQLPGGNWGVGGRGAALNFLQQALSFLHSPPLKWIGVGHFEGLCPHEETKDKGEDESAVGCPSWAEN